MISKGCRFKILNMIIVIINIIKKDLYYVYGLLNEE